MIYRKKAIYLYALLFFSIGVFLSSCDSGAQPQQTHNTPPPAPTATRSASSNIFPAFPVPQGYNIAAQYHGTGAMTFTNLNVHLAKKHEVYFDCLGPGQATVHMTPPQGQVVSPAALNNISCLISTHHPLDLNIDNAEGQVQQIIVITDINTAWQLQLMNCIPDNNGC